MRADDYICLAKELDLISKSERRWVHYMETPPNKRLLELILI
jgi:hypothetical protein